MKPYLTRTVWILSLVSLCTDVASEMLYPVMPLYLKSIGFSVLVIGVLEGLAEAIAGLSKGYFGKLSDSKGQRAIFIQAGYGLSAIAKPLMAVTVIPLVVFLSRTLDRFGKGLRTGARDAMLSDEASAENKGKVFGFHRAMDTLGAVIGPLLALGYLYLYPNDYKNLFYFAFIPGALALMLSLLLREKKKTMEAKTTNTPVGFLTFLRYWKNASAEYRGIVLGFLLFALINSSDVFLLLKAREAGASELEVILLYVFYNLSYAVMAFPAGILADKLGMKKMYLLGLLLFAEVYIGMAVNQAIWGFWFLFLVYGIFSAFTEGISKAWISSVAEKKDTATAIGTYAAFQSITALLASSIAGLIWFYSDPPVTFLVSGVGALCVIVYMLRRLAGVGV